MEPEGAGDDGGWDLQDKLAQGGDPGGTHRQAKVKGARAGRYCSTPPQVTVMSEGVSRPVGRVLCKHLSDTSIFRIYISYQVVLC